MKWLAIFALSVFATTGSAGEIVVEDSYARVAPNAPAGAVFMTILNSGATPDTLVGVDSAVAKRVELHTHIERDGVMMMRPIEGGIEIAAEGMHMLERGGDHVMLMGLTEPLADGDEVELTLMFEEAGEVTVVVSVDNARGQGGHSH